MCASLAFAEQECIHVEGSYPNEWLDYNLQNLLQHFQLRVKHYQTQTAMGSVGTTT